MKLLVLQGPNLDLLGERPGDVPGVTLASLEVAVRDEAARVGFTEVRFVQSNHEGALVDALHGARAWATAVLLNPGALTHASYVLHDALAATWAPVVEVHLPNLDDAREPWRKQTVLAGVVQARIHGKGVAGYTEAVQLLALESAAAISFREEEREAGAAVQPGVVASAEDSSGTGARGGAVSASSADVQAGPVASGVSLATSASNAMGARGGLVGAASDAQEAASAAGEAASTASSHAMGAQGGGVNAASADAQSGPVTPGVTMTPAASNRAGVQGGTVTGSVTGAPSAPASPRSSFSWNVSNIPPAAGAGVAPGKAAPTPAAPLASPPSATAPRKTLGRRRPEPTVPSPLPAVGAAWPSGVPTRADIASRIARHLSGSEPASSLAAYAREGWMRLDAGAEVPPSERPLLEDVLRRLMFLDRKAGALDAQDLIDLLARLQ